MKIEVLTDSEMSVYNSDKDTITVEMGIVHLILSKPQADKLRYKLNTALTAASIPHEEQVSSIKWRPRMF